LIRHLGFGPAIPRCGFEKLCPTAGLILQFPKGETVRCGG
jgi:hypothetical protein